MKQHRTWIALALAGALSLSLLAGCSSGPASSDASGSTPDTSAGGADASQTQQEDPSSSSDALVIAEQGIFSAGGTVIESDGTFDVANYYTSREGSQFPQGEEVLDQFFRQMTPDTGMDNANNDQNIDNAVVAQVVAATIDEIYDRTGQDSILVTHSQGGLPGWEVPLYTDHVAAIVAIEPGGAPQVDSEAYNAMVEQDIPVTFYYGDYIGEEFTDVPAAAMWSMMAASADTFTEAYNAAGGNSTVVHLPDEGITGNDHFMFQDLNNDVIADHIEAWIQENVA